MSDEDDSAMLRSELAKLSEQHQRMAKWIRRYYASDIGTDWDDSGLAILAEIDAAVSDDKN